MPVELYRNGQSISIFVIVEHRKVSRVSWMRGDALEWRGMRLADLTHDSRERMHVAADAAGVVVIDVLDDSSAARARVQIGDVIERIGNAPVENLAGFRRYVAEHAGTIAVRLYKRGALTVSP